MLEGMTMATEQQNGNEHGLQGDGRLVVPELERLVRAPRNRPWSDSDIATLRQYYRRVELHALAQHLGRTVAAVQNKAQQLQVASSREAE